MVVFKDLSTPTPPFLPTPYHQPPWGLGGVDEIPNQQGPSAGTTHLLHPTLPIPNSYLEIQSFGCQGPDCEVELGLWGRGQGWLREGMHREESFLPLPPLLPLPASPLPQVPDSLHLQTDHEALLGEDLLPIEAFELLGLLLQLLSQHRTALRGDRDENGTLPGTCQLLPTYSLLSCSVRHTEKMWKVLGSGQRTEASLSSWPQSRFGGTKPEL